MCIAYSSSSKNHLVHGIDCYNSNWCYSELRRNFLPFKWKPSTWLQVLPVCRYLILWHYCLYTIHWHYNIPMNIILTKKGNVGSVIVLLLTYNLFSILHVKQFSWKAIVASSVYPFHAYLLSYKFHDQIKREDKTMSSIYCKTTCLFLFLLDGK
jgi:hypothetical protein